MLTALCRILGVGLAVLAGTAAADEVRLGFANPFSGPLARSGEQNRVTIDLAVQTLNQRGGVLGNAIRLVAVDDGCDADRAATAALELVKAGVVAVIGHMCSHASLVAAPVYEAAGIPMLTPDSTHPRLTEEGRPNVFRLIGRDDDQGRIAGEWLAGLKTAKAVAIIHDGSTYGSGLALGARDELRRNGEREAIFASYSPGADHPAALVEQLLAARIDVLYIAGYGPDAGRIAADLRKRGARMQIAGGDGLGAPEFWAEAGEAGEGVVFTSRPDVASSPAAAPVVEALRMLGVQTPSTTLGAYAAVQVWAEAVRRAGRTDPAAVITMLHRGRFETVVGRVAFDERGDLEGAVWRWRVWHLGRQEERPPTLAMRGP
ncbi:MAG: branched-chain amino acid ABC transporter substrate-binding protein [Geminicoccaceae bacterium]